MVRVLTLLSVALTIMMPTPFTAQAAPNRTPMHGFPVTVTDDHGFRIHLTAPPRRIVTLDPRDTELLFAIGAEKRIVGDGSKYAEGATGVTTKFKFPSQWPSRFGRDYPTRSKELPHVEGGCCGTDFNLETLQSLRPDLVVAPYSQTELPTFQKMRDLGMKVLIIDPSNVRGIFKDLSLLGKVTGNGKGANIVASRLKAGLASLKTRLRAVHSRTRVYYEIDATNPVQPYTVGRGTFMDEGIKLAGGNNVADAITSCSGTLCYPQISLEQLVRFNPQVIVLGDAAYGTTSADVKARGGWDAITAVASGNIYPFNDELISRAGPRFVIGLTTLAKLLHPSAFKK
ncbi:MAG: ABC transporter substrate-binding protein [Chloroflexota bacterium]